MQYFQFHWLPWLQHLHECRLGETRSSLALVQCRHLHISLSFKIEIFYVCPWYIFVSLTTGMSLFILSEIYQMCVFVFRMRSFCLFSSCSDKWAYCFQVPLVVRCLDIFSVLDVVNGSRGSRCPIFPEYLFHEYMHLQHHSLISSVTLRI